VRHYNESHYASYEDHHEVIPVLYMSSRSIIDNYRSIIDDSRSVIDDQKWCSKLWHPSWLTLEASFKNVIYLLNPGVDLIKLFGRKFTHPFCKLNCFINYYINCRSVVKRSSLQPRVSKFMPKVFYEIDSRSQVHKILMPYCRNPKKRIKVTAYHSKSQLVVFRVRG
jgi:hypothetical protein